MDIKYITNVDKNDVEKAVTTYKIPSNKKILGFIGRLDEQKGIIPFIKELSKHKGKFYDSVIILVGSGSQEEEIKAIIKKLNLEDLFILTGFQENIKSFYLIIDVFFLPSLYEGLPMVLLEAMAFKKPIISMDVGSIKEVIINEETGILINEGDYQGFIKELIKLKNDDMLREKLALKGFEYVNKNYNIKNYENNIGKLYKQLI